MSNFNWQTEDDVNWDDLEPVTETAVSRRPPWLTYVLILAGVIAVVVLIYRQFNQRVEVATANATSDILASHNLVQQANASGDVELFNTLLSGVDDAWVEAQNDLVGQNGLFDRSAFDLTQLPLNTAVTQADIDNGTVNIDLNPELNAADLTFLQDYAVDVGHGMTETVQLKQTAVYRLGAQRWLYAPPNDEFWGSTETIFGTMLNLTYPERDSELAARLARDLDDKLAQMCRTLADLNCPEGFLVRLRFDQDPRSLVDAARPANAFRNRAQLSLPTPTLLGLPVDEAGYQALYRGYAIYLTGVAIARLTNYECCTHAAYFQALLDYQLDELGLRPLNLDRVDYERVVQENIGFANLGASWNSTADLSGEDGWEVITAVDFLRQQLPDAPIAVMQRQMEGRRQTLNTWVLRVAVETGATAENVTITSDLAGKWQAYAFEQYQARQGPPPLPWPAQDIYLLCMPDQEAPFTELYQYQPANSEWQQYPLDVAALLLSPLPDEKDFLLMASRGEELSTYLWQDGAISSLFGDQTITFGQFDPTGQYLLVYGLNELTINRVDWAACVNGDCTLELLGGNVVWSPDGTDFIVLPADSLGQEPLVINGSTILFNPSLRPSDWPLYRGNGQPPTNSLEDLSQIGVGFSPFWLDESTLGFVWQVQLSSNSNRHELVLMSTTDESPRPILSETELQLALPDGAPSTTPSMLYVVPHPHQPERLFIVAAGADRMMYVFLYNYRTDDLQFLLETGMGEIHSLGFSPDGRFLVVSSPQNGQEVFSTQRNDIYLYDLAADQVQTFAGLRPGFAPSNTYDWSADGQWLVIAQENQTMALVAPAYDYLQFIPHNRGDCSNVAWINQ